MKSTRLYFLFAVCFYCVCNFAYAVDYPQGGHTDPRLTGPQNALNMKYRQDVYEEKTRMLESKFKEQPWTSNSDRAVEHFSNLFDKILGTDFPHGKKAQVLQTQRSVLEQKDRLANSYKSGSISFEDYVAQLSVFIEAGFAETSNSLTDEEFLALFQFEKTKIKGSFYELVNQGLNEDKRLIDRRK